MNRILNRLFPADDLSANELNTIHSTFSIMVPMLHHIFNDYDISDYSGISDGGDGDDDVYIDYFQSCPKMLDKLAPHLRAYIQAYQRAIQTTVPVEHCSAGALPCGICLEVPLFPFSTQCNHMFCIDCIQKYMFRKVIRHHCPSCRYPNVSFESLALDSEGMKQWSFITVTCDQCGDAVSITSYKFHQCVNK
jgi:hypothetical protein